MVVKNEVMMVYKPQDHCQRKLKQDDFIFFNVSGMKYMTLKVTLDGFPDTLLGNEERRSNYYVEDLKAYFFDRNRECFEAVLHYHQSGGSLFRPSHIPMEVFLREAKFFGISDDVLLSLYKMEGYVQPDVIDQEEEIPKNDVQKKIWLLVEHPDSSLAARVFGCISFLVIIVSITTFCMETLPEYHNTMYEVEHAHTIIPSITSTRNGTEGASSNKEQVISVINSIEIMSVTWFSLEYVVRFASSPKKWNFFISLLNLIDLVAILPFFIVTMMEEHTGSSLAVVRIARLARVFRIFKLYRHSMGLQILGSTLKASLNELCMMLCVIFFSVILFSSGIYYAEHQESESSMFKSIPDTFWFTVITMTTVGYGDDVPMTTAGKLIGGFCAISGVLTVAMVIPIIVTNFEFFYKRDRINVAHQELKKMSEKNGRNEERSTCRHEEVDVLRSDI